MEDTFIPVLERTAQPSLTFGDLYQSLCDYGPDWVTIISLTILLTTSLIANFAIPRHKKTALILGLLFLVSNFACAAKALWQLSDYLVYARHLKLVPQIDPFPLWQTSMSSAFVLAMVVFFFMVWTISTLCLFIKRGYRRVWKTQ